MKTTKKIKVKIPNGFIPDNWELKISGKVTELEIHLVNRNFQKMLIEALKRIKK